MARAVAPSATSAFHSSQSPLSLKESDTNLDGEELKEFYDAEKKNQLKNSEEGKGEWKQSLASNSEASVKADREEVQSDAKDPRGMQERTKGLPNKGSGS